MAFRRRDAHTQSENGSSLVDRACHLIVFRRASDQPCEPRQTYPEEMIARRSTAAIAAASRGSVFFLLRTNVLNQDGNMLTPKLERDVPLLGAHSVARRAARAVPAFQSVV